MKESAEPNLVVILIIAHKEELSENEKLSLIQCYKVLGQHPIKIISKKDINTQAYTNVIKDAKFDFIRSNWTSTYSQFNKLKINKLLYMRYKKFKYILFYELDAWVFRDELEYWCSQSFDYIGAPWYEGWSNMNESSVFIGVGNGGFSLRKISTHLKVLRSFSYIKKPNELWKDLVIKKSFRGLVAFALDITIRNNTFSYFNNFKGHEDIFWGLIVSRNFDWFILPDKNISSKFSMEGNAPLLFERNNRKLPFGCHAWYKNHIDFWTKFIP